MLISTKTSLYSVPPDNSKPPKQLLSGLDIRRVQMGEKRNIIALSDGTVILLQKDEKKIIPSSITDRIDSLLIIEENPLELLIGCTPPNLYKLVEDHGEAKHVPDFQNLAIRDKWYTPWGGPPAVRSMDKSKDDWIYADIHVGSIMRSPDRGLSWEPVKPTLHKDVHEVATSPTYNDRVYANTYLSVYISDDKGESWNHRSGSLKDRYGRGIAAHPTEPDTILCGVSDGPSGSNVNGQLYWTNDAGNNWTHVKKGFPGSTRKNIDTFHIQFTGDHAWVTDENKLYHSQDKGRTFDLFWSAPEEILAISSV
jgi:photosystem II stability/assembly factor-like uncharacterized protein